jgi:hypothetical protein
MQYNYYNTTMKKVLEKCGWACANLVMVGLAATLGWGILLAIGNAFGAGWVQWLIP